MSAQAGGGRLAIVVHEVRSPVAALAAIAEIQRKDELEPEAQHSLAQLALAACRAIERIVTDTAVASVRLEPTDMGRVVSDTVAAAALRDARVRAEIEPGLPTLEADALRVRQALENLVANAFTHGHPSGDVVVRAHVRERALLVSVSDSGRGIAADEQARIFEPGVRLDPDHPGSGLGLAVVRAIADAHGATLQVDSSPGRGATFTLAFPLD